MARLSKSSVTFHVEGMSDLMGSLRSLHRVTQVRVMERILTKRFAPVRDSAQQMVSVRTGALKRSIMMTTSLNKEQKAAVKADGFDLNKSATVVVGPGHDPAGLMNEFGSVHNEPPQPFMRPAWDANKAAMLDGLAEDLWDEIARMVGRR